MTQFFLYYYVFFNKLQLIHFYPILPKIKFILLLLIHIHKHLNQHMLCLSVYKVFQNLLLKTSKKLNPANGTKNCMGNSHRNC